MENIDTANITDLITLNTVFQGEDVEHKVNVFSTNVFIPEDIDKITIKTYNYFTGFIKLVETFQYRTEDDWILIIYIDKMFIDDKTYNSINTTHKDDNTFYNKKIKNTFRGDLELKYKLNKLLKLYKEYIQYIINNGHDYKRIKLISYECKLINNYKYLGHTSTFGSIIRFLPIFQDNNYKNVVSINISHAISIFFFCEIKKWISDDNKIIMTIGQEYKSNYSLNNCYNTLRDISSANEYNIFEIDINTIDNYRIAAGLFGIKINNQQFDKYKYIDKFKKIINFLIIAAQGYINKQLDCNPFSYGIDEYIITNIFYDILKSDNNDRTKNENIYLLGKPLKFMDSIVFNRINKQAEEINLIWDIITCFILTNKKLSKPHSDTLKAYLSIFDTIKVNYNNHINEIYETSTKQIDFEKLIIDNINNKYNKYLNANIIVELKHLHRFIDVSKFIEKDSNINLFNSIHSNIFYTLLDSLDENNPLLIIDDDNLKIDIDQSILSSLNIKLYKNIDNFIEFIEYYRNLVSDPIIINIDGKQINTSKWDTTYKDILFSSEDKMYNKFINSINEIGTTLEQNKINKIAMQYKLTLNTFLNEKNIKETFLNNVITNECIDKIIDFPEELKTLLQPISGGYNKKVKSRIINKFSRKYKQKLKQKLYSKKTKIIIVRNNNIFNRKDKKYKSTKV